MILHNSQITTSYKITTTIDNRSSTIDKTESQLTIFKIKIRNGAVILDD